MFKPETRIRPYDRNPHYWQYGGKPILLLGGSSTDQLFLHQPLIEELNAIAGVGGNYVRNTMHISQRLSPYLKNKQGLYDLTKWNSEFWDTFAVFLEETRKRDIIVQIEIWDRFEFSRQNWHSNPFNPNLNRNYSSVESGLAYDYPEHPFLDENPFFHSIPGMPRYNSGLDIVRKKQEEFVSKILEISLGYPHLLYCMNNETSTPADWGQYWIRFIQEAATATGVSVQTTDMFDDMHRMQDARMAPVVFKSPAVYTFVDASQINSRLFRDMHWGAAEWVMQNMKDVPRPCNCTKVYGGGNTPWGSGNNRDGVERFLRNLWQGFAGVRFHRPSSGNGINQRAQNTIRSVRELEQRLPFWNGKPMQELLVERLHEVYVRALRKQQYQLLFICGGEAGIDLSKENGKLRLEWLDIEDCRWFPGGFLQGGGIRTVSAPAERVFVATISMPGYKNIVGAADQA